MFLDSYNIESDEPKNFRLLCRSNEHLGPTAGKCMEFVQTNVVFLPKTFSKDFLVFCQRNPKPCPLLEYTETQEAEILAKDSDLYTDLPKYNILEEGQIVKTQSDISEYRSQSFDVFLLGCSFSFEQALLDNGVPVRHIEENKNVPMYITNIQCRPAGVFKGPLVVSMRPIPSDKVSLAVQVTGMFPAVHGAPVHIGDPGLIGIRNLDEVDYGEKVTVHNNEVPVFWACGVTPMRAIIESRIPLAITHSPGHMFVTDKRNSDYSIIKQQ